jgi:hypothetical protein
MVYSDLDKGRSVTMVRSNLAWLIPVGIGYAAGESVWAFVAALMMVLSMTFHHTRWRVVEWLDTTAAIVFLCAGPWLMLTNNTTFGEWSYVTGVAGLALGFYCKARMSASQLAYQFWHQWWHALSALLCASVYYCAFW